MRCLATFETTHMALMFEKTCRNAGHQVRVIPVPRSLSASCGLACGYPCEEEAAIKRLAEERHIEVAGYHQLSE